LYPFAITRVYAPTQLILVGLTTRHKPSNFIQAITLLDLYAEGLGFVSRPGLGLSCGFCVDFLTPSRRIRGQDLENRQLPLPSKLLSLYY
jgi:hypothetical protein